jgi:glyoxalase family protein
VIIPGIHHVTALAGDPQGNLDFYRNVLGLRLVKLTVNFDDPGTYHFYFGDHTGRPGTILTFFPWPHAPRGRQGTGQTAAVSFATGAGAMDAWSARLSAHGVTHEGPVERFNEKVVIFADPDGLPLEIVGSLDGDGDTDNPALAGLHSVTLSESGYESTANLLTSGFGMVKSAEDGNRFRYHVPGGGVGASLDLLCQPDARSGSMGVGVVHHVAFRARSDENQLQWRQKMLNLGLDVTPVLDRQYFHSIYFREPGGVLFEIATDPPGFATDETVENLGTHLKLPSWLEPRRKRIESILPKLNLA